MKEKEHLDVYVGCNKLIRRVWSSCDKMINNYWNESELQIIREHKKYHEDMLNYLDELEINGPLNIEPNKPSSKLPIPNKKKERLVGEKLHEYLVQNLSTADFQPGLIEPEEKTINSLTEYLTKCVQLEKNVNKQSLCFHVRCGKALNILHALWREERAKGYIYKTWKAWVEENINIGDRSVRKKREIADLIGNLPRFQFLTLSFSEVCNLKSDIKARLDAYPNIREYWSNTP